MRYIIASGWWSCPPEEDKRDVLFGDDSIRDNEFHKLWRKCINKYTNPQEIIIVDSAAPLKPNIPSDEKWLEMSLNFGHATNHIGNYSGYTRAIFISMMYSYANDYDYWVYIEQDALIYGEKIIEKTISRNPQKKIFYGSGKGTPQQIQQSFMIFHKDEIIPFINSYSKIKLSDNTISPEWKFLFAANSLARLLPSWLLKILANHIKFKPIDIGRRIFIKFLRLFDQFGHLPFGYGRIRPINFDDNFFYFQHGGKVELDLFLTKMNIQTDK